VRLTVAVTLEGDRFISATESREWDTTPNNAAVVESGERLALAALGKLVAMKVCGEREAAAQALADRLRDSAELGKHEAMEQHGSPLLASTLAARYAFEWLATDGNVLNALGPAVVCDAVGAMAREVEEERV
jgi:hypothetical protein